MREQQEIEEAIKASMAVDEEDKDVIDEEEEMIKRAIEMS